MFWILAGATLLFAAWFFWKVAPGIAALDRVTRPHETHYERFQRLVKEHQVPGYVYATTATMSCFGIVAEDLDGKVVYADKFVSTSDSPFMASDIKGFMSSVNARKSRNGKDYI